jgi:hypothetical protein
LLQKNVSKELVIEELKATIDSIQSLTIWSLPHLEKAIRNLQEKNDWHKGQFFMMLRLLPLVKSHPATICYNDSFGSGLIDHSFARSFK